MKPFIISHKIFGVSIHFELINEDSYRNLSRELANYPSSDASDVVIKEVKDFDTKLLSSNPKSQIETSEGFIIRSLLIDCHFKFKEKQIVAIDFKINENSGIRKSIRKQVNIQYTNRTENIGQILHENVLVPLMLLRSDRLVTHASGVQLSTNKAILFGGTGGVGKTSIEIMLCQDSDNQFIADDICIIDEKAMVYPNLNYPKIYAYNLVGNKELKEQLSKDQSLGDKIQWNLRKKIGLDKVRRKLDPALIFGLSTKEKMEVASYFFVFRSQVDEITIEDISAESATNYSSLIIKNEYSALYNHIRWHEYNRKALGMDVLISENAINMKLEELGKLFFTRTRSYLLKIPSNMPHDQFLSEFKKSLLERI
jgi:hypothetical protein